jgi:GNAT superfamily N-acetyltransferase
MTGPVETSAIAHDRDAASPEFPLCDLDLARRLERAEAAANAAFVAARARVDPSVAAEWQSFDGVYAMFDGAHSPLTQTFGLGVLGGDSEKTFADIEAFFRERGASVQHEVSPYMSAGVLDLLNTRGYRPIEFSTVLVQPTVGGTGVRPGITVREIEAGESARWSRCAADGWRSESEELGRFIEDFGRILTGADGVHCFFAEIDGEAVATATLSMQTDVALLAGASTVPAARGRGVQLALLDARLRFAAARGAPLAMMVAQPGSGSQRNAERRGFRVAYTRTKWQLPPR